MTQFRQSWLAFASVWLLLLVIFAHAMTPGPFTPVKRSGSAFSAHTSDVSLGPSASFTARKIKRFENSTQAGDAPVAVLDVPAWTDRHRIARADPLNSSESNPAAQKAWAGLRARAPPHVANS